MPVKKTGAKSSTTKKTAAKKSTTTTKKAPAKKTTTAKKTTATKKPAAAKKTATTKATKKAPIKKTPVKKAVKKDTPVVNTPTTSLAAVAALGQFSLSEIEPYPLKKNEEYMNDAQRDHLQKILLAWRQSLMENSEDTVTHMKDEAANFPDPNDRASQEEEFSIELRTRDRERKLIKKIEETLDLLRSEDFGYCVACGVEIGMRRLEARPTATLCIDCKELAEIKEKQTTGG